MPLTLLPSAPSSLPSSREFLKFEVGWSGRPAPASRPSLPSQDSFSSTSTDNSSSTSSSSRRKRPTLSPEALLIHGLGPSALSQLSPPVAPATGSVTPNESQSSSSQSTAVSASSASLSSRTQSESSRRRYKEKGDYLPSPPPRGTFRSAVKSMESPSTQDKLSLTELNPFHMHRDNSPPERRRNVLLCECERTSEREPPMSPEAWREKKEGRPQRRILLHMRSRPGGTVKIPVGIDRRPLEDPVGLAVPAEACMTRTSGLSRRNHSSPALSDLVNATMVEEEISAQDRKVKHSYRQGSGRRKSMVELQDIGGLVKQTEVIRLDDPSE